MVAGVVLIVCLKLPSSEPAPEEALNRAADGPLVEPRVLTEEPFDVRERSKYARDGRSEEQVGQPQDTAITFSEEEVKTTLYGDDGGHSAGKQWLALGLGSGFLCVFALLYRYQRKRRHRRQRRRHRRRVERSIPPAAL